MIAPLSTLHTLRCLSLVRGLADGSSGVQSTDLGRTLEATGRRNRRKPQPQAAPGQFPLFRNFSIPQSPPTPHCQVLCFEIQLRLLQSQAFQGWVLHLSTPSVVPSPRLLHQNVTSEFPKLSSMERPPNMVFRSLALLLCGCVAKQMTYSFLIHKTRTQQSLAPRNGFEA